MLLLVNILIIILLVANAIEDARRFLKDDTKRGELIKKPKPTRKKNELDRKDYNAVAKLKPLKDGENIMFWRPQKVGSSSILSILMSYGYRYNFLPRRKTGNNAVCRKIGQCIRAFNASTSGNIDSDSNKRRSRRNRKPRQSEIEVENLPQKISLQHEICYGKSQLMKDSLPCAFSANGTLLDPHPTNINQQVKEIFMVREPISRAISSYYFWGELYRMSRLKKRNATSEGVDPLAKRPIKGRKKSNRMDQDTVNALNGNRRLQTVVGFTGAHKSGSETTVLQNKEPAKAGKTVHSPNPFVRLGSEQLEVRPVQGRFKYHGDELTVPPIEIAMAFCKKPPFKPGMPGPSLTWSLFANDAASGVAIVSSDRMMTIVLERLDESLVAMRHYLGWSLADVVVTKMRKALSKHPGKKDWPAAGVAAMQEFFEGSGEMAIYNASNAKLDSRIAELKQKGIDFDKEVVTLKSLRKQATKVCLDLDYLENYRLALNDAELPQHASKNKLRDVENYLADGGHTFSFNREILGSFDVCGSCEAHAMLLSVRSGVAIENAPKLKDFDRNLITSDDKINFEKCPKFFISDAR